MTVLNKRYREPSKRKLITVKIGLSNKFAIYWLQNQHSSELAIGYLKSAFAMARTAALK